MKVIQCMGCRVAQVEHEGIAHGVRPADDRLIPQAKLSFCDECNKHANMLVNMYAKMYGYAAA